MLKRFLFFVILFFNLHCSKNPVDNGEEKSKLNIEYYFVTAIGTTSADVWWGCSSNSEGYVLFGRTGLETILRSPLIGERHFLKLLGLTPGTTYRYQVVCKNEKIKTNLEKFFTIPSFTTISLPPPLIPLAVIKRGIWLLGGVGSDGNPVKQVDLFDPDEDRFYKNVTSIPTPRIFASIVALNGKIYVIGGLTNTTGSYTPSNLVEELTISETALDWKTLSSSPVTIHGALGGAIGDSIYILGGAISISVTSALPNLLYKFSPGIGSNGTWTTINSLSPIPPRVDLSGCVVDGIFFFNNGRDNSGTRQFTSDAYLGSVNSTTSVTEASFSLDRFSAGSACYRPIPSDLHPSDSPAMFVIGGSNNNNLSQPPTAIFSSDRFEFYNTPSSTNSVIAGPNLPEKLYAPAAEVSYTKRKLYVFGGATTVNIPRTSIYSIDLANPSTGPWTIENTVLPVARYGHQAIILSR